jgi:hypothetical protein
MAALSIDYLLLGALLLRRHAAENLRGKYRYANRCNVGRFGMLSNSGTEARGLLPSQARF